MGNEFWLIQNKTFVKKPMKDKPITQPNPSTEPITQPDPLKPLLHFLVSLRRIIDETMDMLRPFDIPMTQPNQSNQTHDPAKPNSNKSIGKELGLLRGITDPNTQIENNLLPKSFLGNGSDKSEEDLEETVGNGKELGQSGVGLDLEKPVNLSNFSMILHGDEPGINYSTNSNGKELGHTESVNYKNNYESEYRNYKKNASKSTWVEGSRLNGNKRIYKEIMNHNDPESMFVYKKRKY